MEPTLEPADEGGEAPCFAHLLALDEGATDQAAPAADRRAGSGGPGPDTA